MNLNTLSGGIINMDDYRSHMVVPTSEKVHVYPTVYFENFAKGEPVDPIPLDVMRVIVREWLDSKGMV